MKTLLKTWLYETFSLCFHNKLTYPRRDEQGDYQRCLDCGKRIQSKIQFGHRRPPWGRQQEVASNKPSQAAVDNYLKTLEIGPAAGRKR